MVRRCMDSAMRGKEGKLREKQEKNAMESLIALLLLLLLHASDHREGLGRLGLRVVWKSDDCRHDKRVVDEERERGGAHQCSVMKKLFFFDFSEGGWLVYFPPPKTEKQIG